MARILVTGSSGFIGHSLCKRLTADGHFVRAALRTNLDDLELKAEQFAVGDIGPQTFWAASLTGIEVVIHAAARVHIPGDPERNRGHYIHVNALGTERLAQECVKAGVRRLILISSLKVNGEGRVNSSYHPDEPPNPTGAYAKSKLLAEEALLATTAGTGTEAAIVRPPLVYGPGVRANFFRLLTLIDHNFPLPFGRIDNRRSLVSVWNVCDLIVHLIYADCRGRSIFMVSDGEDVSTADLIRKIAAAMGKRPRLIAMPPRLLRAAARLTGRSDELAKLCDTLCVDISVSRSVLGWTPPVSLTEGLTRTVAWYLSGRKSPPAGT